MLIVTTIWKVLYIFSTLWKVQFKFSTLWKLQGILSITWKECFNIFCKTGCKVISVLQCARWILSCNSFKMVCNWILYSVNLACHEITKIAQFFMAKCWKSRMICYAKNVKNHTAFVEGFWPEFYARGRFMKYSMSVSLIVYPLSLIPGGLMYLLGAKEDSKVP